MSTKIDAQNVDSYLDEIGETGSAKVTRSGFYTRREENCDWLFCGEVEAEDVNDVLQICHDRGKLHGTWDLAK
jgi:hypothetical protein